MRWAEGMLEEDLIFVIYFSLPTLVDFSCFGFVLLGSTWVYIAIFFSKSSYNIFFPVFDSIQINLGGMSIYTILVGDVHERLENDLKKLDGSSKSLRGISWNSLHFSEGIYKIWNFIVWKVFFFNFIVIMKKTFPLAALVPFIYEKLANEFII